MYFVIRKSIDVKTIYMYIRMFILDKKQNYVLLLNAVQEGYLLHIHTYFSFIVKIGIF